jgi:hypothetical protein
MLYVARSIEGMEILKRIVRELLIFMTVISVPLLLGRAIYRAAMVVFTDAHIDCSESAAMGAGIVVALLAILAYLIIRGVQFVRSRREMREGIQRSGGGLLRVFLTLAVTFIVASVIDGLSMGLASATVGLNCNLNAL